ncbi:meiotic recombination protein SPO11-like [Ylistrum balloti]|uniref:meiotic recombination protein SPO11-like n=1 Tax=Ylistrum balloti TaxID=509963 RepID=UPI002905C664|nr:meiotic recombination protein SPO11-like [Ylistrum balloti]
MDYCEKSSGCWRAIDNFQKAIFSDIRKMAIPNGREKISAEMVLNKIENVILIMVRQISSGEPPTLICNSRTSWDNIRFEEDYGLMMRRQMKMTSIRFNSQTSVKKLGLMMKVLGIIYRLVQTGKHCTKRDIYYQDVSGFGSQAQLDETVDNISCLLDTPRWSLHVLASSKGCIAGDLSFQDGDGNLVDCKTTRTGVMVPNDVRALKYFHTDASFILVVEKDATFQNLIDNGFCTKLGPAILITGKGFPDVNTRMLLRTLWDTFHIPVMVLVDADPHGIEIMSIYKYGSRALSHESSYLTVPSLCWIGVLPSDVTRLSVGKENLLPMTRADHDKAFELKSRPYYCQSASFQREVDILLQTDCKAEIQCLESISTNFLIDVYLPGKLQHGGWI